MIILSLRESSKNYYQPFRLEDLNPPLRNMRLLKRKHSDFDEVVTGSCSRLGAVARASRYQKSKPRKKLLDAGIFHYVEWNLR